MGRKVASSREMTADEENAFIASFENSEWVKPANEAELMEQMRQAARNTMNPKRRRISIAVPEPDLQKLKARALREGIPYQTLINSLIHKYVDGAFD